MSSVSGTHAVREQARMREKVVWYAEEATRTMGCVCEIQKNRRQIHCVRRLGPNNHATSESSVTKCATCLEKIQRTPTAWPETPDKAHNGHRTVVLDPTLPKKPCGHTTFCHTHRLKRSVVKLLYSARIHCANRPAPGICTLSRRSDGSLLLHARLDKGPPH